MSNKLSINQNLLTNADQIAEVHDADESVQELVDQVREDIEKKTERKFDNLRAVKYRMNMMDGIAYLIKVKVNRISNPYIAY